VWLGWVGRQLWMSLPWTGKDEVRVAPQSTTFTFEPELGNGAWSTHRPAVGYTSVIVEGSDVEAAYPLAAVVGAQAAVLVRLDYLDRAVDVILPDTQSPFHARYVTGWKHAGFPERRKSWRRPRFIINQNPETVGIRFDTYKDYNETSPSRSHTIAVDTDGTIFWRLTGALEDGGFNWGDGTLWGGAGPEGAAVVRAQPPGAGTGGLGVNRAIQLHLFTDEKFAGRAWGIQEITLKYIMRKFTT